MLKDFQIKLSNVHDPINYIPGSRFCLKCGRERFGIGESDRCMKCSFKNRKKRKCDMNNEYLEQLLEMLQNEINQYDIYSKSGRIELAEYLEEIADEFRQYTEEDSNND